MRMLKKRLGLVGVEREGELRVCKCR